MENKAVTIGRKHKWNVEGHRIVEGLLHAVTNAVVVVLRLDDCDRDIGLVVKDVIGALGFATGDELPSDDDASLSESDLFTDLHHPVPTGAFDGGAYELGADIALAN